MKTFIKIAICLVLTVTLLPSSLFAQVSQWDDPKWAKFGKDNATREANVKNYSFFRDSYRMNSHGDVIKRLNELLVACPDAKEDVYTIGTRTYRMLIDEAETNEIKEGYIKELLRLYQLRSEHFGEKNGSIVKYNHLSERVLELLRHDFTWEKYKDQIIKESNFILKESKGNLNPEFIIIYFGTITNKFLEDKISAELVLSEYEVASEAIANCTQPTKDEIQKRIDGFLISSGAANCDNLITLFKPQYEKDPNNLDLIKKIMRHLNNANCDSPFKLVLSEKYYKLDPSADAAYSLATTFAAQKNTEKAVQYFKEAIAREDNKALSSKYETQLAISYLVNKKNELSANHAKRAMVSDPRNGYAVFILAQAYTIGSSDVDCDGFEKKAVNWLIANTLEKAKALTSSDAAEMKDINKQLTTIRHYFPTTEDLFFKEGMKVGDSYTVNCGWIKGETKVQAPQ